MPREPFGNPARYKNVITTLSDDEYAQLLAWIEQQPDPKPTRSAALRGVRAGGIGRVGQVLNFAAASRRKLLDLVLKCSYIVPYANRNAHRRDCRRPQ
jgi:hypothetical protein